MHSISFGNPDLTWQQYNLSENPIDFNGEASVYKAVVRGDELVAIVGKGYQLLPNEEALKIANEAAKLCGLEAFKVIRRGNVLTNAKETRMHAWYGTKERFDVNGEQVQVGVDVRNSIDGTMSFGCGAFTYREMCSNGVILGKELLASYTHLHTKGLKPVIISLKNRMVEIMDSATQIIQVYREMAERKITEELVDKIKESTIPKKVLPDYLKVDGGQTYLVGISDYTEWNVYNDITEAIWHNVDTDVTTKNSQFNALHRVMPLVVRG